jgi:hypothetical protein
MRKRSSERFQKKDVSLIITGRSLLAEGNGHEESQAFGETKIRAMSSVRQVLHVDDFFRRRGR